MLHLKYGGRPMVDAHTGWDAPEVRFRFLRHSYTGPSWIGSLSLTTWSPAGAYAAYLQARGTKADDH